MRLLLLLQVLLGISVLLACAAENGTKPVKKTLRTVKRLKKLSKSSRKSSKARDQAKSASYHYPIVVSSEDVSHVPVKLELHDDDRYIKSSSDMHPIEPIHLVNVNGKYHYQETQPIYIESKDPLYSTYPAGETQSDPVYHGPVAVPADYPPDAHEEGYSSIHSTGLSPNDYFPKSYGDLSAIPGSPGIDYPTYASLPKTGFECLEHTSTPGFYADVETKCQMWHYCQPDGRHDRFLCPNGTLFDQLTRVCNWWYNVHCDDSLSLYDINFDLYREPKRIPSQSLDITPYHSRPAGAPSQSLDVTPYHSSPSAHPKSVETVPNPNSFLRHVKDFEASRGGRSQNHDDYKNYVKPIQSAANPRPVHRYPSKIAPAPRVVHDHDKSGPIDYDSSNAHTLSTPSEKSKHLFSGVKSKPRKKNARRKLRRHPKIYAKNSNDDIPTYREGKVTPPPASRRYRVVRRRKFDQGKNHG